MLAFTVKTCIENLAGAKCFRNSKGVSVRACKKKSGHHREAEKVSATGADRLRECVTTEFV